MNELTGVAITLEQSHYFSRDEDRQTMKVLKGRTNGNYTDEAILDGLRAQDKDIIMFIYRNYFRQARSLITGNSGTRMDAEDVFQDALVIIYRKVTSGSLVLTSSFGTYLYSICRNLWLQRLSKAGFQRLNKDLSDLDGAEDIQTGEAFAEENEKSRLFGKHFALLSQDDQKILRLFMQKVPLAQIAAIMGYKSYEYAKTRKYLVKEKLKNSILNDPGYRAIFQHV